MYEYIDVWIKNNDISLIEKEGYTNQKWLGYRKTDGSIIWAGEYYGLRRNEYLTIMQITDQLDVIYKGLKAIRDANVVTLPQDTLDWISKCDSVKINIPKPPDNTPYVK
nr:MAG TPA: hypothetical protein [Caudoviricetes sp.]